MTTGSIELIFPTPFIETDSIRTSIFLDAGSVFTQEMDLSDNSGLRVSAGLGVQWLSPLGPLVFSLGYPLNEEEGDQRQPFQFTIGAVY